MLSGGIHVLLCGNIHHECPESIVFSVLRHGSMAKSSMEIFAVVRNAACNERFALNYLCVMILMRLPAGHTRPSKQPDLICVKLAAQSLKKKCKLKSESWL